MNLLREVIETTVIRALTETMSKTEMEHLANKHQDHADHFEQHGDVKARNAHQMMAQKFVDRASNKDYNSPSQRLRNQSKNTFDAYPKR